MTSGKHRRREARERIFRQLERQTIDRIAVTGLEIGAELIEQKFRDQMAAQFLASSARAITNAGVLNIIPSLATNGETRVVYIEHTCIRCSSKPIVSSVGSRASYCEIHWARLWLGT
jgi:hypothetical protein